MKEIILKMEPGVADTLIATIGIGYIEAPEKLKEGSGFGAVGPADEPGLYLYWVGCDGEILATAVNEMIAKGLTITFPPEPDPVVEEVPIA